MHTRPHTTGRRAGGIAYTLSYPLDIIACAWSPQGRSRIPILDIALSPSRSAVRVRGAACAGISFAMSPIDPAKVSLPENGGFNTESTITSTWTGGVARGTPSLARLVRMWQDMIAEGNQLHWQIQPSGSGGQVPVQGSDRRERRAEVRSNLVAAGARSKETLAHRC